MNTRLSLLPTPALRGGLKGRDAVESAAKNAIVERFLSLD